MYSAMKIKYTYKYIYLIIILLLIYPPVLVWEIYHKEKHFLIVQKNYVYPLTLYNQV